MIHCCLVYANESLTSLFLPYIVILDLTEEQYCEALRVDYAVAFARTCAGVHYGTDNLAGLNLGQEIIADKLAQHLATTYGSDPDKVQAKMDRLRFDWANFDSFTCTGAAPLEEPEVWCEGC